MATASVSLEMYKEQLKQCHPELENYAETLIENGVNISILRVWRGEKHKEEFFSCLHRIPEHLRIHIWDRINDLLTDKDSSSMDVPTQDFVASSGSLPEAEMLDSLQSSNNTNELEQPDFPSEDTKDDLPQPDTPEPSQREASIEMGQFLEDCGFESDYFDELELEEFTLESMVGFMEEEENLRMILMSTGCPEFGLPVHYFEI